MSEGKQSLAGSSILVFFAKLFTLSAGLIISLIIARSLGPDGQGLYTVAFATINMVNSITSLGMNRSLTIMYANKNFDLKTFYGNAFSMLLFSAGVAIVLVSATFATGPAQTFGWPLLIPALASIPFILLIDYGNGIFLAKQQMKSFNASQMQRYAGYMIGLLVLLFVVKAGLMSVTMGFLIGAMAGAASPILRLGHEAKVWPRFDKPVVSELVNLGLKYAVAAFVIALNYRVNVLVLERSVSIGLVGVYGLGVSLVEVLWQIPTAVGTVLISKSANSGSVQDAVDRSVKALRLTLPITILAGVALYFAAGPLMLLFFGQKLSDAGPTALAQATATTRTMIPGVLLGVIYKVLGGDLAGRGEPLFAARSYAVAVIVNLALSVVLIRQFNMGIQGGAIASSVGYSLGALLFLFAYLKRYEVKWSDALIAKKSDFAPILKKLKRGKKPAA
jgi:O-antigen/teichoic acid export membrane protein